MALDFPSEPSDGQTYGNYVYSAAKGAWKAKPSVAVKTAVGSVAPSNPVQGDTWLNSDDGTLYVYYTDANSSQWVEILAKSSVSSALYGRVGVLETEMGVAQGDITSLNTSKWQSYNYIINGAFDVWQRGTSFSSVTGGVYTADRWVTQTNAGSQTITRVTDTPSGYNYALRLQRSSVTYCGIGQRIEAAMAATLIGGDITVSFWAKSPQANQTVRAQLTYPSATDNYTTFTVDQAQSTSISTSWTKYSFTFSSIGSVFATGMELRIGTNSSAGDIHDLYIAEVQLEEGSVATPFRRNAPSIQAELAACQRYFETQTGYIQRQNNDTARNSVDSIPMSVPKRVSPTSVTVVTNASGNLAVGTITANASSVQMLNLTWRSSTASDFSWSYTWSASAEL